MAEPLSFISIQWVKPLLKRLQTLRRKRHAELDSVAKVFGDPDLLAKYYIEPKCQNKNPADSKEDEPVSTAQEPVFSMLNRFFNRDIIERDGASQLFILSDAGMGKTSLLMMLKLMQMTSFWPKTYNCVLIKLGPRSRQEISSVPNRQATILLLDALDEDSEALGRVEERLTELLADTRFFHRVIISCRTQFFPESEADSLRGGGQVTLNGYVCPVIYLSLFDDEQVEQYLKKRFPRRFKDIIRLRKNPIIDTGKSIVNHMGSLRFRPLLLSYIHIFTDLNLTDWSAHNLYGELIDAWLYRELRKIQEEQKTTKITKNILFQACVKLALYMHIHELRCVNRDLLESLIGTLPSRQWLERSHIEGRSLLTRNSLGEYRFAHISIQEYLVSYAICKAGYEKVKRRVRVTDQMIRFIRSFGDYETARDVISFENLSLINADLTGMDLQNVPMKGARLRNCDLSGAILSGANCEGADMTSANLSNAHLVGVNMKETNLEGVNLKSASIRNSNLQGANLKRANLRNADLSLSNLTGADLRQTIITDTLIQTSRLDSRQVTDLKILGASFKGVKIDRGEYVWRTNS